MTKKLSECPYCKRPADERGGINHVGGCTGLQNVVLNRLQYDGLQNELAILRGNLSLAEEGLASAMQEIEQLKAERDFARRELDRACQETREALSREVTAVRGSNEPSEQLVTTDYGPALLAICKWSGCTSTMAEGDPYFCPTHRELARRNAEESSEQLTTSREDGYAIQRAQLKSEAVIPFPWQMCTGCGNEPNACTCAEPL